MHCLNNLTPWGIRRTSSIGKTLFLSTKWVDYVEEPMKYQALRPQFFSVGGWGWQNGWGW